MSVRFLQRFASRPWFKVDYPSIVVSAGADFTNCGTTPNTQVAAPTYINGLGAYTYAWTKVSGSAAVNITATNVERPAFNAYACESTGAEVATYEVEVTDTTTGRKAKDQVEVTCTWTNLT